MRATLTRTAHEEKQTRGVLELFNKDGKRIFECLTLELPWKHNQRMISCIPKGDYEVVPRVSQKFSRHLHITNVPNRDWILIHPGNFYTDILGCILVGSKFSDVNKDGVLDVLNSKTTMSALLSTAPNGFTLTIKDHATNQDQV